MKACEGKLIINNNRATYRTKYACISSVEIHTVRYRTVLYTLYDTGN
jgi:hypothetical protein